MIGIFDFIWGNADFEDFDTDALPLKEKSMTILGALESYDYSEQVASDGFLRTRFTSNLVKSFIDGISLEINKKHPVLSKVVVDPKIQRRINILKHFTYKYIISSSRLKVVENRGFEIVKRIFEKLADEDGYRYLPEDFQKIYNSNEDESFRKRLVCDFISGMTDRYALEFYGRLFSENPQTIFKPL